MDFYGGKFTVCPFYLRERQYKISCEGLTDSNELGIFFTTTDKKEEWQELFCFDMENYEHCPIAGMLFQKYEE